MRTPARFRQFTLSLSDENIGDTGGRVIELTEALRGSYQHHDYAIDSFQHLPVVKRARRGTILGGLSLTHPGVSTRGSRSLLLTITLNFCLVTLS